MKFTLITDFHTYLIIPISLVFMYVSVRACARARACVLAHSLVIFMLFPFKYMYAYHLNVSLSEFALYIGIYLDTYIHTLEKILPITALYLKRPTVKINI